MDIQAGGQATPGQHHFLLETRLLALADCPGGQVHCPELGGSIAQSQKVS